MRTIKIKIIMDGDKNRIQLFRPKRNGADIRCDGFDGSIDFDFGEIGARMSKLGQFLALEMNAEMRGAKR